MTHCILVGCWLVGTSCILIKARNKQYKSVYWASKQHFSIKAVAPCWILEIMQMKVTFILPCIQTGELLSILSIFKKIQCQVASNWMGKCSCKDAMLATVKWNEVKKHCDQCVCMSTYPTNTCPNTPVLTFSPSGTALCQGKAISLTYSLKLFLYYGVLRVLCAA